MPTPIKLLLKEPFTRLSRRFLALIADGQVTPAEFVLLTALADRTVSWRRLWEKLSYDDLQDLTGLARQTVADGLAALQAADLVARKKVGRGYAYALVPDGMTAAQLLELCAATGVDNPTVEVQGTVYSVDRYQSTQQTGRADPTYIAFKKDQEGLRPSVDRGLKEAARPACPTCGGEGWVVRVEADGFTEAVAKCPCVTATA